MAFFTPWCPAGTGIETLVRVEGAHWAMEDAFECAKTELGLDHNETRSWHRHVSLIMLAFAMLAAVRYPANKMAPQKKSNSSADDALISPGNPPGDHALGPATDRTRLRHCRARLAKSPSSRTVKLKAQL
jgi:SRSO17 transposase